MERKALVDEDVGEGDALATLLVEGRDFALPHFFYI